MLNTKALYKLSYGLYVVGSRKEARLNAQIANTVFQIRQGSRQTQRCQL